jgi:carboxyl-terminal processing protease
MKKALLIATLLLMVFTACKKSKPADDSSTTTTTITTPTTGSTLDFMRDSMYLYAKEDYYWHNDLPTYDAFKPRSFTGADDLTALNNELYALSQYAINPSTSKAYEYNANEANTPKYSFIDEGEANIRLSAVTGDFGFSPGYNTTTDLRVLYVYPGSPADIAGLKRGYKITSINGQTDLTYNTNNINTIINAYAYSSSITMTLVRPDNSTFAVSMNTATYKINPVITSKVIDWNGKKVGYIVFNSFVTLASAQDALNTAFTSFTTAGVTDLVVDLRYNGGGYVETAEFLDNLIAPTSANSQVMYTAYYNDILSANKETLLKNQVRRDTKGNLYNYGQVNYSATATQVKFAKAGSLNINRLHRISQRTDHKQPAPVYECATDWPGYLR